VKTPEVVVETPPQPETPKQPVEAPKENNQAGPKNIAWDKVLQDYCTADEKGRYPSLRDLAAKYDIGESSIMEKSTRENWVIKRSETIAQIEQLAIQKRANDVAEANSAHLTKWRRLQNLANRLLNSFESRLNVFDNALKELEALKDSSDEAVIKKLKEVHHPGAAELNIIASTLKVAIEGERIVLGLPTIVSKSDVSTSDKVTLPPETVAEIDRLFALNHNDKQPDPIVTS
jgi:hypothetical protein